MVHSLTPEHLALGNGLVFDGLNQARVIVSQARHIHPFRDWPHASRDREIYQAAGDGFGVAWRSCSRGLLRASIRCQSLDLEIIAQGEAEEKNEGDRYDVLHNHEHLNA